MQYIFAVTSGVPSTICPRSSYPLYIVTYYINCVTTSWPHSKLLHQMSQDFLDKQYAPALDVPVAAHTVRDDRLAPVLVLELCVLRILLGHAVANKVVWYIC